MRVVPAVMIMALAFLPQGAGASCAGPTVELDRDSVRAGDDVVINGEFFIDGCNDTGGTNGCGMPLQMEEETPITDVRFELRFKGRTVDFVQLDADDQGRVRAVLSVPPDARPGGYRVVPLYWGRAHERLPLDVTAPQRS